MTRFYDKKGRRIEEFDVVKVWHFTSGKTNHYMYHWIGKRKGGEIVAYHLTKGGRCFGRNWYPLKALGLKIKDEDARILLSYEIVQSNSSVKERLKGWKGVIRQIRMNEKEWREQGQ